MRIPRIPTCISPRHPWQGRHRRASCGQAMIELYFIILLFFFIAIMVYEIAITYHNFNVVNNALKQGAWLAGMGAPDEDVLQVIANADTQIAKSLFFKHQVSNLAIEVCVLTPSGEIQIAPTSKDIYLSPGSATRAAYIWRACGNNIRIGCQYKVAFSSLFFGADPVFSISVYLGTSQVIAARNDEDQDGLVDLYEPELFTGMLKETWVPFSHRDNGRSDLQIDSAANVDGDQFSDLNETGLMVYDYDNDGWADNQDPDTGHNAMRHPILGGNKAVMP